MSDKDEYIKHGLLPNRAGRQALKEIKLNEQISTLTSQLEDVKGERDEYKNILMTIFPKEQTIPQWVDYRDVTYDLAERIKQALSQQGGGE